MYVVFHCNAAKPLPKRYKTFSAALAKANKFGWGWCCDTIDEFLKRPYATILN